MPLTINTTRTFHRTVTLHADGDAQTFGATFNALPDHELSTFDTSTKDGQTAFLRAAVSKLDDIVDAETGAPAAFTKALLLELCEFSDIRNGLLREFTLGIMDAKQGN